MDFKDQVIFERDEVMTQGGTPFSVFTPYKNAWLKRLAAGRPAALAGGGHAARLAPPPTRSRCRPCSNSVSKRPTSPNCACPPA
jgi:deoxyribodipyrimidine photo-lyase